MADLDSLSLQLEYVRKAVDRIEEALNGNGQPGLKIRTDRLEQAAARGVWLRRSLLVSFFPLAAAAVFGAMK